MINNVLGIFLKFEMKKPEPILIGKMIIIYYFNIFL